MLTFIGLGLYDEHSITVEGKEAIEAAEYAFAEFYTSRLIGTDVETLEQEHEITIDVLDRAAVEQHPEAVLDAAASAPVVFLTAGDPMISTTHVDLRMRAIDRGISTEVIHGVTAQTAASSLTGLQNYRFGRSTTLPFPWAHGAESLPASVREVIDTNQDQGVHTLVYLDIKVDDPMSQERAPTNSESRTDYMTGDIGASILAEHYPDQVGVVVARAGSPSPLVVADRLSELATMDFGDPLHMLIIPGNLHQLEADALISLAGANESDLTIQ